MLSVINVNKMIIMQIIVQTNNHNNNHKFNNKDKRIEEISKEKQTLLQTLEINQHVIFVENNIMPINVHRKVKEWDTILKVEFKEGEEVKEEINAIFVEIHLILLIIVHKKIKEEAQT